MVTGIVLVNVERAMIRTVIEDLMKIEGVSEVYAVAGEYDLVVMIRVNNNVELADIQSGPRKGVSGQIEKQLEEKRAENRPLFSCGHLRKPLRDYRL